LWHVEHLEEIPDDFHFSVSGSMVHSGPLDTIRPVFHTSVREVDRLELLESRDGVDQVVPKGFFRVHEFVSDAVELVFGNVPPLVDRIDHVVLDELEPFAGYLSFALGFLDELIPYSARLLLSTNLFMLYAQKVKELLDVTVALLGDTDVTNDRVRVYLYLSLLRLMD
jgi:hypothetical protein